MNKFRLEMRSWVRFWDEFPPGAAEGESTTLQWNLLCYQRKLCAAVPAPRGQEVRTWDPQPLASVSQPPCLHVAPTAQPPPAPGLANAGLLKQWLAGRAPSLAHEFGCAVTDSAPESRMVPMSPCFTDVTGSAGADALGRCPGPCAWCIPLPCIVSPCS